MTHLRFQEIPITGQTKQLKKKNFDYPSKMRNISKIYHFWQISIGLLTLYKKIVNMED